MLYADKEISLQQGNVKKSEKLMKIVKTDGENLHIFLTASVISMAFPEKMWLTTKLKGIKNQCFILSLEDTFLKNPQGFKG